ncbi:Hypothetical protein, putative [Bodo saltans]|uniref:Uncharacterized protein n=1 Tax=Bodo saltans TaxID=75058 RepID=A0A0S4J4M5_BODSA|nr:Hypothetical protein, putative [Bodo saltans]|eukprot:CUG77511.1 Hypothetical protein, putative [Bodo saltans]
MWLHQQLERAALRIVSSDAIVDAVMCGIMTEFSLLEVENNPHLRRDDVVDAVINIWAAREASVTIHAAFIDFETFSKGLLGNSELLDRVFYGATKATVDGFNDVTGRHSSAVFGGPQRSSSRLKELTLIK